MQLEEEKIRNKIKLETLAAEAKRDREEREAEERKKRIEADWERKIRVDREEKEAAEKAAVAEYERKQREAKQKAEDAERALKEKLEREDREQKEKDKQQYEEFKRREKEKEEKEKREWDEFERKRKEKEEKEKQEKAAQEKGFQDEMRNRLRALGYTEQTIEIMVDKEKAKSFQDEVKSRPRSHDRCTTITRMSPVEWHAPVRAPVYPKVHKDYIELKTLEYYQLPWHYDRVSLSLAISTLLPPLTLHDHVCTHLYSSIICRQSTNIFFSLPSCWNDKNDPDFIIIQRDMDKRHTDVLFEHTARIRKGILLLKPAKKQPKLAMYRKRSRSRHDYGAVIEKGVLRMA